MAGLPSREWSQARDRQRHQPAQAPAKGGHLPALRTDSAGLAEPLVDSVSSRAQRFEDDKRRIIASCFDKKDDSGPLESYITHIRVTEDAAYPTSPAPPNSPPENKKPRVIIAAVRQTGRVCLHKARENTNGLFSIGKTWPLEDLSAIEVFSSAAGNTSATKSEEEARRWAGDTGFTVTVVKPYYWQAETAREKDYFIGSLIRIYRKYTGGKVPTLVGFHPQEAQRLLGTPAPTPTRTANSIPESMRAGAPVQSIGSPASAEAGVRDERRPAQFPAPPPREPLRTHSSPRDPFQANPSSRAPSYSSLRAASQARRPDTGSRDDLSRATTSDSTDRPLTNRNPSLASFYEDRNSGSASKQDSRSAEPTSSRGVPNREKWGGAIGAIGAIGLARTSESQEYFPVGDPRRPSTSSSRHDPYAVKPSQGSGSPARHPFRAPSSTLPGRPTSRERDDRSARTRGEQVISPSPSTTSATDRPAEQEDQRRPSLGHTGRSGAGMAERRAEDGKSSLDYVRGKEEVKAAVSSSPRPDRMPFAPTLGADRRATPDTVETVDTASFRSVRSDRATTPPTASTAPATLSVPGGTNTVPQPSLQPQHEAPRPIPSGVVPSKEEEESHRPGLGPMIKQPEEPHRPGLGPMIKQRSARDVASAFRKAATAYNAFKPRAGGQGSWRQDEDKGEDGAPDGINGVVPAPSLVARASQDHVTTTHTSPSSGTASRPILSRGPSGSAAANATPLSTTSASGETRKPQENAAGKAMAPIEETSKAQEKAAGKAIAPTEETSEETYRATLRASSLSLEAALQAKHDELARPRPARPDPTIHYAEILGIPHSMLCPPPPTANTGSSSGQAGSTTTLSGTELVNILHDIGWVECQKPAAPGPGNNDDDDDEHGNGSKINMRTSTVDELLAELQRQITRTEREGWLAVIDRMNPADVINRHDEQVEELRKLFDVALEQCDAVDDMIALHLAELSTFNEDFNYLVEQSGGLAMEVANSVWLRSELEERIRTQTESERINGIPEGQDRLPEEEEEEQVGKNEGERESSRHEGEGADGGEGRGGRGRGGKGKGKEREGPMMGGRYDGGGHF